MRAGVLFVKTAPGIVAPQIGNRPLAIGNAVVLANGDELHLGRDDALARIPELGHGMALAGAQGTAPPGLESRELDEPVLFRPAGVFGVLAGEIAVVLRPHFASLVFLNVAALQDPIPAQRRKTFLHGTLEFGIAPRPRAIVDAHWLVHFQGPIEG